MTDYLIYEKRRKLLASNMHENSIAIIEASPEKIRNNDSTYRYRQCSNFYYLTGYNKSGAILVVQKKTNSVISHFYSKKPNINTSKRDSIIPLCFIDVIASL